MMIPKRFEIIPAYLKKWLLAESDLPPLHEVAYFLLQPSKLARGQRYIEEVTEHEADLAIKFKGCSSLFYYSKMLSWIDFCATVDEIFNPYNWHHYETAETPLHQNDVLIDCGCAEGLFTFVAASKVKRIIAFEPLPRFLTALHKTFCSTSNIEIRSFAVGNQESQVHFTNNGIYSAISSVGDLVVEITTLDQALTGVKDRISFIKADIEGYELQMLQGAKEVIKQNRPKLALTVYHQENNTVEIKKYLKSIHADYQFRCKGIVASGKPVMLHVW